VVTGPGGPRRRTRRRTRRARTRSEEVESEVRTSRYRMRIRHIASIYWHVGFWILFWNVRWTRGDDTVERLRTVYDVKLTKVNKRSRRKPRKRDSIYKKI
jgi:hypothetical protein